MTELFEISSWVESLDSIIYELDYESRAGICHGEFFVQNLIEAKELIEQALVHIKITNKIFEIEFKLKDNGM